MKKGRAFFSGVLSGIVEPLGAVLTILAAQFVVLALPYLLSFAAAIVGKGIAYNTDQHDAEGQQNVLYRQISCQNTMQGYSDGGDLQCFKQWQKVSYPLREGDLL